MAQAGAAGGVLKTAAERPTESGRRVGTSPQLQVAALRGASGSHGPGLSARLTRPGSAAGPAGGTRPAGVGTARRGPPLQPGGSRWQSWCIGAGAGTQSRAPTAARPCLRSPPRRVDTLLCGAPGARGVRAWGCSCVCSRAESPGRKVSPALTAGGCQAPHLLAPVFGTRSLAQYQRPGSVRKGATEGFVNGATARKLRLADAKGLVSRVRRKAIYGRVAGFPSVYAQPLPFGTRSNSVFTFL